MSKANGRLAVMGSIDVLEPDGEKVNYPKALLITFDSPEEIRQAIKDMELKLRNYHDDAHVSASI